MMDTMTPLDTDARPDPESGLRQYGIRLDFRAYFHEFSRIHGEPVLVEWSDGTQRFLFADGWTYGLRYQGPEWGPPAEPKELNRLQRLYLVRRLEILETIRAKYVGHLERLESLQQGRSLEVLPIIDDPNNELADLQDRLQWLMDDMKTCHEELAALKEQE